MEVKKWYQGEPITAKRLNEMLCATLVNSGTIDEIISDTRVTATTGYSDSERFITQLRPMYDKANRADVFDEFDLKESNADSGIMYRPSGVENAVTRSYPCEMPLCTLAHGLTGNNGDIVQNITTDAFGNVVDINYSLDTDAPSNNSLWQGAVACGWNARYHLKRRIGRVVDSCTDITEILAEGACAVAKNAVIETNDLVMPILPGKAELEEKTNTGHSVSLLNGYSGNTVMVRNLNNEGGMVFTPSGTRLGIKSGIEIYAACLGAAPTASLNHIEPQPYCVAIADMPIRVQHFNWNEQGQQWQAGQVCCKGALKINAKNLNNNNWQVGVWSEGSVEIPQYDFTPSGEYTAGPGITINNRCISAVRANSATTTLGSVDSISLLPAGSSPAITNGQIQIPAAPAPIEYEVVRPNCNPVPIDGICGWVRTAYQPQMFQLVRCQQGYVSFLQMQRFKCGRLEVSYQRAILPEGVWCEYWP